MNIHTDSLFIQGTTHKVCQDYAVHEKDFIIVSDGCSSSPKTDIGSRILCQSAKDVITLNNALGYREFGSAVISKANVISQLMRVPIESLDATLLIAFKNANYIHVYAYGDGNIIVEYKDGRRRLIDINFKSGAPYYLSYWLDNKRKQRYTQEFFDKVTIEGASTYFPTDELAWCFDINDIRSVTLCSDGYDSFLNPDNTKYFPDLNDVIAFKNTNGEFLNRQIYNGLFKKLNRMDIAPYDDFGIAAIVIED